MSDVMSAIGRSTPCGLGWTAQGSPPVRCFAGSARTAWRSRRPSKPEIARLLKDMATKAGIDPTMISGHSVRVGMSQDLVAAGADLAALMQAGRWKTPTMPARYSQHLLAAKGAVAQN
jgi:hypothetical protein